jgi:hypothetical protein
MPASWEIMEVRRNRVLLTVIIRTDARVSVDWALRMNKVRLPPGSQVFTPAGAPFHTARNSAAAVCIQQGFGWVFYLDSDILPPIEVVDTFLASGRDLVGGLYFKRQTGQVATAGNLVLNPSDKANPFVISGLPPFQYGEIIPVDFIPMGATLVSRRCLEAVAQAFKHPFDWGYDPAFGPYTGPDGQPLPGFSEDYIFSYRAKQLGFQPWLHTGVQCLHEVEGMVGMRGLLAREEYLNT